MRTPAGDPVFGATLTLTGPSNDDTTSDANGDYSLSGLAAGTYTVTPSRALRYFYPSDAVVVLQDFDATGVDFESHVLPSGDPDGKLSGTVTAVDPANYSLTVQITGGGTLALFVYVDTVFSGEANSLEEVQVGFTIQSQYFTSANLAVELDVEP